MEIAMNTPDTRKAPPAKARTGVKKPVVKKHRAVLVRAMSGGRGGLAKRAEAASAEAMLGVTAISHRKSLTPMEWVNVIRHGIPSAAVDSLTSCLHVSQSEFAEAVGIPERTLVRRKKEGLLNSEESAKLVRVARVYERAEEVFEDPEVALDWLKSANPSFSGAAPMSLLDTEIGAESVMDTLGRIEHGVFA
jgi:putative toxin-antitoxin system antitoxin component (TIGR02293 family)